MVIAVGAHRSRDLSIPGIEMDGVLKGIDFLLNSNLGYRFSIGKRVVVIGGGNVAMDVARSAAREVLQAARRRARRQRPVRREHRGRGHARNDGRFALRLAHGSARGQHRLPGAAPRNAGRAGRDRRSRGGGHRDARRLRAETGGRPQRQRGRPGGGQNQMGVRCQRAASTPRSTTTANP